MKNVEKAINDNILTITVYLSKEYESRLFA